MNRPCIMPGPFYIILLSVTDKALQLLAMLNRIFPQSLYSIYNHYNNFKMPCCNSSIVGTTKWKPAYRLYKATRLSYILQIDFFFSYPYFSCSSGVKLSPLTLQPQISTLYQTVMIGALVK